MNGAHHFNEVILDNAHVPDEMVFGAIGNGWTQVTSELSFERSGPERFLSTFVLLAATAESIAEQRFTRDQQLGRLVARIAGLHQMSAAVAGALERNDPADLPAAVVKVLGTSTEGDIAELADLADSTDLADSGARTARAIPSSPPWSPRRWTSGRASPCVAEPTKCCAVSSRVGWDCDERHRAHRRPRPGGHDGGGLRPVPHVASPPRQAGAIRRCGSDSSSLAWPVSPVRKTAAAAGPAGMRRPSC